MNAKRTNALVSALLVAAVALFVSVGFVRYENERRQRNEAFFNAVMRGEVTHATLLLEQGADPNVPNVVLKRDAASAGWLRRTARRLLSRDRRDDWDRTYPIEMAVLLQNGPSPSDAQTQTRMIKTLASHGADLNRSGTAGTALFHAVEINDVGAIKTLIKAGANPNTPFGEDKATPLMAASKRLQPGAVRALLARGANPNATNVRGETALHYALYRHFETVFLLDTLRALLAHGANPNVVDKRGNTPLAKARLRAFLDCQALSRYVEAAELLRKASAPP